jgi:hypothetical protein
MLGCFGGGRRQKPEKQLPAALKPAPKLLLTPPVDVSPIEPEMVTPSNSFCSARPAQPFVVAEDSDRPAVKLVPVSPMASLADWSVSNARVRGHARHRTNPAGSRCSRSAG